MADTMARMQISNETSTWLLQARVPERKELRQTAKVLREIAKLEGGIRMSTRT